MKSSRSLAKRLAAEARQRDATATTLPPPLERLLAGYTPSMVPAGAWADIQQVHHSIMRLSQLRGEESFRHRCAELASYLAWRLARGQSIAIGDAMTFTAIDEHYVRGCDHLSEKSRNDRRSRLRKLAERSNPALSALPRAVPLGYKAIKPGYNRAEELAIMRVALRQRRPATRRSLCIVVGCCAGAGLDSADLRHLRQRHFEDRGEDGIVIHVPGTRARRVVVRYEYEQLVRVGLEGLSKNGLVIGREVKRRNLAAAVIADAEIVDNVPHIEPSRLRSTWLTWLMHQPVPLNVVIAAAGLKTARTLLELMTHIDLGSENDTQLRGDGEAA